MKKWFRFFGLSFFSHKISKESVKHGYSNIFLGFLLALVFLWSGFMGGDMLPFASHYKNAPDFSATAGAVFANSDPAKRIVAKIQNGDLKVKKQGGEYTESLLINTFESEEDKQNYSSNGFGVVVDSRPADTLAEIEAYCISNDGKNTIITYEEYLTLSEVARLNFEFKIRYTGNALELDDASVAEYRAYVDSLGDENKAAAAELSKKLQEEKITKNEYNREIYKLYFTNYYQKIDSYESTSTVPLLRNYYYHEYISRGISNYLFIFDDYMAGSFETKRGVEIEFYGFYSGLEDGALIAEGASEDEALRQVDSFIKKSFNANGFLNAYAYLMNIISLMPFIALMLMVAALLSYSVMKLCGIESVSTLADMIKIIGSFVWFSGVVAGVFALIIGFFVNRSLITALALLVFFLTLVIRSVVFVILENKINTEKTEQQMSADMEV